MSLRLYFSFLRYFSTYDGSKPSLEVLVILVDKMLKG